MALSALLVDAWPLLVRLGLVAASAIEDMLNLTDAERAAKMARLLRDARASADRAGDLEELGHHRRALARWRRADRQAARAAALATAASDSSAQLAR